VIVAGGRVSYYNATKKTFTSAKVVSVSSQTSLVLSIPRTGTSAVSINSGNPVAMWDGYSKPIAGWRRG
jgi:hypothetical protein